MTDKLDLVLTTWRRELITLKVLEALKKNTSYPYRLIIVDSGSKDGASEVYSAIADVYVKLDANRGLEYAKHIGMVFVESSVFVSTDNDILVPKPEVLGGRDWLESLVGLFKAHPDYGAIALRPQVLVGTGDIFGTNPPDVKEFSHVPGYMRIMNTKLTKDLGAWNDKRPLRGHEEYWISERMNKAGFKVGWASKIPCYHVFGDSNWGYDIPPSEHGHNPVALPQDDWQLIKEKFL